MKRVFALAAMLGAMAAPLTAQDFADYRVDLVDQEDVSSFLITMGPVDLAVMSHGEHGASHEEMGVFPPILSVEFPRDAYLKGFSYEVVNGDGERISTAIVHHLNFITPERSELFLPISQRLLAMGKETGSQSLPGWLLGVPVEAGGELVVSPMLHNPTGEQHEDVQVRVRLDYVDAGGVLPFLKVYPFQLDVAFPAGDKSVDLPPGPSSFSWEGSPRMAGRIMAIGSHLHELATSIRLEDVSADKVLWEGLPLIADDGETVEGVTIGKLYRRLGVAIDPEHVYRVTVDYDNPGTETITAGGMGVVAGVFMPSGSAGWPLVDTSDPLYQLDRKHYMRQVRGDYDLIAAGGGAIGEHDGMEMEGELHDMGHEPVDPGHDMDMEGEGHDTHEDHGKAGEHRGPGNDRP
jgi:hypothetical protein